MNQSTLPAPTSAPPKESIVNDDPKLFDDFPPGTVAHQGDLMYVSIPRLPNSAKPRQNRQLADGNTQGSRHILMRGELFDADPVEVAALIQEATKLPNLIEAKYIGPVFTAPESPTAGDVAHPEHGDLGFPAGTHCAVVYQKNLDAEQREQRTQD